MYMSVMIVSHVLWPEPRMSINCQYINLWHSETVSHCNQIRICHSNNLFITKGDTNIRKQITVEITSKQSTRDIRLKLSSTKTMLAGDHHRTLNYSWLGHLSLWRPRSWTGKEALSSCTSLVGELLLGHVPTTKLAKPEQTTSINKLCSLLGRL